MAAPLNTCTTIQQRGVRFLWAKNMEAKDIHKEMLPMYGEHCLLCQAIHNLVQRFSEGRTSSEDEHRAGRPVPTADSNQTILRQRFPGTCETVGQVFKFVRRLC
jgi:hypothetical protein